MGLQPEPGAPLESVYAVLFQKRQDARFLENFLQARATLDAPLQTVEGAQTGDELKNIVEEYVNTIFPFQKADSKKEIREMAAVLKQWVENTAGLQVEMLPDPAKQLQVARRLKKGQLQQQRINQQMSQMVRRRM